MADDRVIGDGGNVTIYERPDGSRYALDKQGRGTESDRDAAVLGRARFDARERASGRWDGSRSRQVTPESTAPAQRARLHSRRYRQG